MRSRLDDEARIAERYGQGSWAYFRGALFELSRHGMWNRVLLVFCSFSLQNMSGAAAINYYSPTLFKSLGITDVALYTGVYGLVKGAFRSLISNMESTNMLQRLPRSSSTAFSSTCGGVVDQP
jgi:hypothetical protein